MAMGNKIINFKARNIEDFQTQLKPYPAIKSLPKWFTDAEPYEKHYGMQDHDGKVHVRDGTSNATFKKCTPLLDGMGSGYIIPLFTDVEVDNSNSVSPAIYWKTVAPVFMAHGSHTNNIIPPPGYHSQVFKYSNTWIPQTPKGYSCLVVSPIGHNDLVFKAIPAVIDTDKSTLELVFPMWVKKDFNGIVEKGIPLVQIIPFKRDNWESTFNYYGDKEYLLTQEKNFNSTIVGHYLKNHWSKKSYK